MVVDNTIDAYAFSLAFYVYNSLWDIFVQTGLVYFPIIALIFSAVKSAAESSMEDFNSKSSLRTVSMGMFFMILALELALYPMVPLKFDEIKYYARTCTSDTTSSGTVTLDVLGEEAEFVAGNMEVQLGGKQIRMPVLFAVAFRIGQGIKNWAVDDLPCTTDIRLIADGMMTEAIPDEAIRKETQDFIRACYNPARRKYLDTYTTGLPDEENWPGSSRFVLERGMYDNADGDGFYSRTPRLGYQNSVNVLAESAQLEEGYGFPTCKEWWLGVGVINRPYISPEALSTRLYEGLSDWLKAKHVEIYETLETKLSRASSNTQPWNFIATKDAVVMQSLFTPVKLTDLNALSTTDYGTQGDTSFTDWAFRAFGTVGVASSSIEQFSGASMLQLAMPMVKPFIIMIIVISYLPAMIMSQFRWKYIGLFHGVVLSMMFWPFFWELSRLIDDTLLTALGISFHEVNTKMLSQWIASSLYLYAPLIFSTALGWVGMVGAESAFQKIAGAAGSAGNGGFGATKKLAGKAAKAATPAPKVPTGGP